MARIARVLFSGMLAFLVVACTQTNSANSPNTGGPRYTQPGIGGPARQTDFFGNDVLRR